MEYALAPLLALVAVVVLGVLSRWVFAPNVRRRKDYGLLVPVATITVKADAERVRDRLTEAGVRATVGTTHQKALVDRQGFATVTPAGHVVLVWPDDLARARALLAPDGSSTGG